MIVKYIGHLVFIPSLVYSLYVPSFESALLTLIALGYHSLAVFVSVRVSSNQDAQTDIVKAFKLEVSEIKDDVTKIKMAHGFKR